MPFERVRGEDVKLHKGHDKTHASACICTEGATSQETQSELCSTLPETSCQDAKQHLPPLSGAFAAGFCLSLRLCQSGPGGMFCLAMFACELGVSEAVQQDPPIMSGRECHRRVPEAIVNRTLEDMSRAQSAVSCWGHETYVVSEHCSSFSNFAPLMKVLR